MFGYTGSTGVVENVGLIDVNITGDSRVGGLIGTNNRNVENTYSTVEVTGENNVGGLIGWNHGAGSVKNSYAIGNVTGEGEYIGGLIGDKEGDFVYDSFYDTNTTGQSDTGGGDPKTTEEMQNISTFSEAGWNITTTSEADPTDGYPFLSWQTGNSPTWKIYEEKIPTLNISLINPEDEAEKNPGDINFTFNYTSNMYNTANCTLTLNGTEKNTSIVSNATTETYTNNLTTGTYKWNITCTNTTTTTTSNTRTLNIKEEEPEEPEEPTPITPTGVPGLNPVMVMMLFLAAITIYLTKER